MSKFQKRRVLVIGGAGYIGSAIVRWLHDHDYDPLAYDNGGNRSHVPSDRYLHGNLFDRTKLKAALKECDMVVHCAAHAKVGESASAPRKYWQLNVEGTQVILKCMATVGVKKMVFCSTAATYGQDLPSPIKESDGTYPCNVYGMTKVAAEMELKRYCEQYDFDVTALRFFNAAGASACGKYGEHRMDETHLIPLALRECVQGRRRHGLFLNGEDFPTFDGTCVRDYVHVDDIAFAAELALDALSGWETYNVGTGEGTSNLDVLRACKHVTRHNLSWETRERREGDPPVLVADSNKLRDTLDWDPEYRTIEDIVESAWKYHKDER